MRPRGECKLTSVKLEYRALTLLEALAAGRSLADADPLAAVFPSWPAPARSAARRLAAHANAARGGNLLWLIGLNAGGKVRGKGCGLARLDGWLAGIMPFFDGVAPRVRGFSLPSKIVALHIETDRAPFVTKGGSGLEVPWLDAAGGPIRPAGRVELIKLLSPLLDLPQLEILEAELTFYRNPHPSPTSKATFRWTLDGSLYILPRGDGRVVIPLHRCRGQLTAAGGAFSSAANEVILTADKNSPSVRVTESAALIEGLGRVFFYCSGSTVQPDVPFHQSLTLLLDLVPAGADRAAAASATLRPAQVTEGNQAGRWKA